MASMKGKDILVIDDAADVRLLVKRILEGDGARVIDAESIEAGLEAAQTKSPHLIVLDLLLSGKTGFDFLATRKDVAALKEVPVIILSGKKDKASISQAIALGANDYILKPLRATLLLQKVRKALMLTSFVSKTFEAGQQPKASFSLSADIVRISEGGCQIESSVKLGTEHPVKLMGKIFDILSLQHLPMKVTPHPGTYVSPARYLNEVSFAGVDEDHAKRIRALLREFK